MKVTNTKCQCTVCKEYFNSTAAFDAHRVGYHRVQGDRRCLSVQEMAERGFQKNLKGYWVTAKNTRYQET